MGTRHLTEVKDGNHIIMTMYGQWDGYPSGHGTELRDKFGRYKIVNGLQGEATNIANGMGCLAAQIVTAFKDGPGSFYLYEPGARDIGEEYIYILSDKEGRIWLELYSGGVTFFGAASEGEDRPEESPPIWAGYLADLNPDAMEC